MIAKLDALTNMSRLIVDRDSAFHDELFHLQSRPHTGLRENFVELGSFRHGRQYPLGGEQIHAFFIRVELPGHHISKAIARHRGSGRALAGRRAG